MKFVYRTNLIIGVISAFLVVINVLLFIQPDLTSEPIDQNQILGTCVFIILGTLMFICAYKLKMVMKREKEKEQERVFLSETAN